MEKKVQVTQDELTTIQANLYKTTESIESLRAELKFSKQELEEWVRVQNEKEDDNAALLKYSKEDTNKIKQLSLTMEKLMSEVQKKKNALNAEVTETQVSQLELDKTTNEFKTLHQDRQQMIQQWENALQIINKRDEEVQETQMNYLDLKATLQKLQGVINEKQAFLNQQLEANEVAVKKMGLTDRTVSKYRLEHTEAIASLSQFQDEVDAIRNSLSKSIFV